MVVPPWMGHVNPAAGVATILCAEGHEIGWVGNPQVLGRAHVPGQIFPSVFTLRTLVRDARLQGMAALQNLWLEVLVPLAQGMDADLLSSLASFRPDAMIVDQQAIGAALRCQQAGIPWITLASSPGELVTFEPAHAPIRRWITDILTLLARDLSCPPDIPDIRFSPHGTIMPSCPALMGDIPPGMVVHATGSLVEHRRTPPSDAHPPTHFRPHVLVSMGTVSDQASSRFLQACCGAAASRPDIHWTIVDPTGNSESHGLGNVTSRRHVDLIALLPQTDVVVCHAGHNTVSESLLHGVPLVVAPIRDDQPGIARRVELQGAGVRLRFSHAASEHIVHAVDQIIQAPRFAESARGIGAQLRGGERRIRQLMLPWLARPQSVLGAGTEVPA